MLGRGVARSSQCLQGLREKTRGFLPMESVGGDQLRGVVIARAICRDAITGLKTGGELWYPGQVMAQSSSHAVGVDEEGAIDGVQTTVAGRLVYRRTVCGGCAAGAFSNEAAFRCASDCREIDAAAYGLIVCIHIIYIQIHMASDTGGAVYYYHRPLIIALD